MKRWLFWIGGVAVVLVVLVGVLALTARRSDAPFDFLGDHKPVRDHRFRGSHLGVQLIRSRYYTFKADVDALAEGARQELLALGYKERSGYNIRLSFTQTIVKRAAGKRDSEVLSVTVWTDSRLIVRTGGQALADEKGWVTVHVQGERPPPQTLLDKLRSWLGL